MRDYFAQVRAAASTSLYYLALEGTLVIPDMCAALDATDGRTTGALYIDWFNQHVAQNYVSYSELWFSGEDCYGLRCAMLHQARLKPPRGARVIFLEPGGSTRMHKTHMKSAIAPDAFCIDIQMFADEMLDSAEAWLSVAEQTPVYQANYAEAMKRYPFGLEPYVSGIPVIG